MTKQAIDSKNFLNSAAWLSARRFKLSQTPWCEDCHESGELQPAADVDHVKPRHSHPELSLIQANLRSLCKYHHGLKTAKGL